MSGQTIDELVVDKLTARLSNLGGVDEMRRGHGDILGGNDAWYPAGNPVTLGTSAGVPIGNLVVQPFRAARTMLIDRISFNITATGGAGARARVGIYSADQRSLYPTNLLVDGGDKDATVVAPATTIFPAFNLVGSMVYWFAYLCGVGAPTVTSINAFLPMLGIQGGGGGPGNIFNVCYSAGVAYGALPDPFPAGSNMGATNLFGQLPLIIVRGV